MIYTKFKIVVISRGKKDVTEEGAHGHLRTDKVVFLKLRRAYRVFAF